MMRMLTWIFRQRSIRCRISCREICAIVMTTCSMPSSLTRRGRSSVVPEDAHAVDDGAPLFGVVVDEPLHVEVHVAAPLDLPRREQPGPAGADEERRHELGGPRLGDPPALRCPFS